MPGFSSPARLAGRATLAAIALLDLGAVLLAVHAPSLAGIAAATAGPVFVVVPLVGAYVAARRPANPVAWIFLAAGIAVSVFAFSASYAYAVFSEHVADLPGGAVFAWLTSWTFAYTVPLVAAFGVLLFPDGRLPGPGRGWRALAWLGGAMLAGLTLGRAFAPQFAEWPRANPLAAPGALASVASGIQGIGLLLLFPVSSLTAAALVGRARQADAELRPVMRLAAATGVLIAVSYLACLVFSLAGGDTIDLAAFQAAPVVALAAVATVGIVRYGLFDLRVALDRTLVYGALTLLVVALYEAASALAGLLIEGRAAADALAGAVVALAALPLRDRLRRAVDGMLYGDRDNPYAAISRLSERLDAVAATGDVLPAVARTVSESLRLPYVAVEVAGELAAACGRPGAGSVEAFPLSHQGERVGRLLCATRAPGERFGPADLRLLRELARHVAVAAREVLLTRDLQRSREQLIRTREEERRRLRRELHDGVGPSLAGIALGIDSARRCLRTDRDAAERTLVELRRATRQSVAEVRRLAGDLRPPVLDQLGLVGALRELTQRLGGALEAPAELPELPAAVEVAAYRIAAEALTNAGRHARAEVCRVRVSLNGGLRLEVDDDGVGIPDGYVAGVGIASMRERARELGGGVRVERRAPSGTRVSATLPLSS